MDNEHYYRMNHGKHGYCLIVYYEGYDENHEAFKSNNTEGPASLRRRSAEHDCQLVYKAFDSLGYEVQTHKDLTTSGLLSLLEKVVASDEFDHSDKDSLVVVFMGHCNKHASGGDVLLTFDGQIDAVKLYEDFQGPKCLALTGKPKLFFIQACRGDKINLGIQVEVDGPSGTKPHYVTIPTHADTMVMWATYTGFPAFRHTPDKSSIQGYTQSIQHIQGCIFIHFLAMTLLKDGQSDNLSTMLLKITRQVAMDYCTPINIDHYPPGCRQVPEVRSSLLKEVFIGSTKSFQEREESTKEKSVLTHDEKNNFERLLLEKDNEISVLKMKLAEIQYLANP